MTSRRSAQTDRQTDRQTERQNRVKTISAVHCIHLAQIIITNELREHLETDSEVAL